MYFITPVVFSAVVVEVADLWDGEKVMVSSVPCRELVRSSLPLGYLARLSLSRLPGKLLNAAVLQTNHKLRIRTLERCHPRSQDHVHSGPEPLSELILHSQFTAEGDYFHNGFSISIVGDSDCTGTGSA